MKFSSKNEEKKRKREKPTTRSIAESHYSVERCNDSSTFDLSAAITPSLPFPFHPAIGRNGTKKKMGRVEKAKGETDERKNRWKGKERQVAESELQSITLARMTTRIAASPLVITVRRFTAGRLLYSRIHVDGWRIREPLHDRISTAEEDDIPSCNLLGVATARPFYRPGKLVRLRDEARPVSPMENHASQSQSPASKYAASDTTRRGLINSGNRRWVSFFTLLAIRISQFWSFLVAHFWGNSNKSNLI